jgi:hypothetical protein
VAQADGKYQQVRDTQAGVRGKCHLQDNTVRIKTVRVDMNCEKTSGLAFGTPFSMFLVSQLCEDNGSPRK